MSQKRAFISFDFDNDEQLRDALIGQSRLPQSPFSIADWSVHEPFDDNWRARVRERINQTHLAIVICGYHTHQAKGVAAEISIIQELGKPYFLLAGHPEGACQKPGNARSADKIYKWTWDNLAALIAGNR